MDLRYFELTTKSGAPIGQNKFGGVVGEFLVSFGK
jgi:hypothetical protein